MSVLLDRLALRFAETNLYWRGRFFAKDMQTFLGVSERTARTQIARCRDIHGILPKYRPGLPIRGLTPKEHYCPDPSVSDPNMALLLLVLGDQIVGNPFSAAPSTLVGHDTALENMPRATSAERDLMAALLNRRPVLLSYTAKSRQQDFYFHPAAVARARGRFHMRGFRQRVPGVMSSSIDDRFVDIVPARVLEARMASDDELPFIGLSKDRDWNEFELLRARLSSQLTEQEQICYRNEFRIGETGVLEITTRRALLQYVWQELAERRCWRRDGTSVSIWSI